MAKKMAKKMAQAKDDVVMTKCAHQQLTTLEDYTSIVKIVAKECL